MKKLLLVMLFAITAYAQDTITVPRFEIGAYLGQPLGLSAKWWYGVRTAAEVTAAWSFTEDGIFEVDADYLIHPLFLDVTNGQLPVFFGLGAGFRIGDEWFIGARLPLGIEYILEGIPLSLVGEIVPQWQFLPENKFVLGGGVGIRLTFGSIKEY
jgi:hypothetical protein